MNLGYIIGRFNPIHIGHMHIIEKMMSESDISVILIGSSNISNTKENPFSFQERKEIIQKIYPTLIILPIPDFGNLKLWVPEVERLVNSVINNDITEINLYTSKKDTDADLRFNWCSKLGHNIKGIVESSNALSATKIREIYFSNASINKLKEYVHYITFDFLKNYKNSIKYKKLTKQYKKPA